MSTLRKKLIRLAFAKPELRADLLPLLRQASEVEAGRTWNNGQVYGPPYQTVDPEKPPKNRGPGKCFYQTGKETDRCYEKRNIGNSSNKKTYNKKYNKKVYRKGGETE